MAPHEEADARTELADAVRALVVAWWNLAAYPPGHPRLGGAVEAAHRRLVALLGDRPQLRLGVGRTGLLLADAELTTPHARKLVRALATRGTALLRIERGVEPWEVERLCRTLAADPRRSPAPAADAAETEHVHLHPVDYSTLRVTDDVRHPGERESLHNRMVRALLAHPDAPGGLDALWRTILLPWLEGGGPGGGGEALPSSADVAALVVGSFERATAAGGDGEGTRDGAGHACGAPPAPRTPRVGEVGPTPAPRLPGDPPPTSGAALVGSAGPVAPAGAASGAGSAARARPAPDAGTDGDPQDHEGASRGPEPEAGNRAAPPPGGSAAPATATPAARLAARLGTLVAGHLGAIGGPMRLLAARRVAELAAALPPALRDPLLAAALGTLAADGSAGEALHALSSPFAPDVILGAFAPLAAAGVRLSRHALRLVHALSAVGPPATRSAADPAVADLVELFRQEDVDRYNPEDHQTLLARAALELSGLAPLPGGCPADLGERVASLTDDALARQLGDTLLELAAAYGAEEGGEALLGRLESLVRLHLVRGDLDSAAALVGRARALADADAEASVLRDRLAAVFGRLASPNDLAALIAALPAGSGPPPAAARALVVGLGPPAVTTLLLLLTEEPRRGRRRRLFDLLVALGPAAGPSARSWLTDARWYVVRNMIVLLRAVGDTASLPEVERATRHPDRRVRVEALKSLLCFQAPGSGAALERAMRDPHPKVAELAIAVAGRYGGPAAVEPLLRLLRRWDPLGRRRRLRLRALWALGELGDPDVLRRLRRFFRERPVPLVSRAERRAAFQALRGYPPDARRGLVARGLRARDPEIRATCARLAEPP